MFALPWNFPFRKKDGSMTTLDDVISSGGSSYTLPTASAETKGGVKIGNGLTMEGEVLNATPYNLPKATAEILGGIMVGSGLSVDENGVLSASGGGSSIHLFKIATNQIACAKAFVLTSVDAPITNKATLITALTSGFGFIIDGSISGDTSALPLWLHLSDNGQYPMVIYDTGSVSSNTRYSTSNVAATTINVTSTKIF